MNIQICKNGKSFYGKIKILDKTYNLRFGRVKKEQADKMGEALMKQLTEKFGAQLMDPVDVFQPQIDKVLADVGKRLGDKPGKAPTKKRGKRGPYKKRKDKSRQQRHNNPTRPRLHRGVYAHA